MLRRSEAQMLEHLFRSKSDPDGRMNLCQFLLLCMERSLISNKFGLKVFREIFHQASDRKEFINSNQFGSLITLISSTLYKNDPAPNDRLLTHILSSTGHIDISSTVSSDSTEIPAELLELLSGPALDTVLEFEPYTRSLFVKYLPESLSKGRHAVMWKEIEESGQKLPLLCFLRLLLGKYLIPEYIEVEAMQELIRQTVKPQGVKETQFYQSGKFILSAEDPHFIKTPYVGAEGEPQMLYHQFQLILGRLGMYHSATAPDKKGTAAERIKDFFTEKLGFTKGKEGIQGRSASPSPVRERVDSDADIEEQLFVESDEYLSESDTDDPYQKMELLQQRREEAMKKYHVEINYEDIEREFGDLPPVPPLPESKTSQPIPKTELKVQQLGKYKDRLKKKEEKKQQKQKPAIKKPTLRRGEVPPPPIKFADKPKPYPAATLQAIRVHVKDAATSVIQQSSKNKFGSSHVAACIIKEVYFPPEAPLPVATLIESANVYLATEEYELAVSTFEDARETWKKELAGNPFKVEYDLFFELSIANVLESSGQDEIALVKYISAKNMCSKGLPSHHPDVAIPYCGIASVLYHLEEYTLSLRAYLKAKEIREDCLGGNTVDTATTYNNLGCCMLALARYQEANAYFLLSHAILQMELGPTHERTMTAFQNMQKAKRMPLVPLPEYQPPWNIAVLDRCPIKKRGGKKKGKRKR